MSKIRLHLIGTVLLTVLSMGLAHSAQANATPFAFTVIHTNDLHSQVRGAGLDSYFTAKPGDDDPVRGHYARLAHLIKKLKKERSEAKIPVLTVDAGDFFSGSLFHALAPDRAGPYVPELQFFHDLGFDAVSLGNHEFDAGEEGLAIMLAKARSKHLEVELLASNIQLKDQSPLTPFFNPWPIGGERPALRPYIIRTLQAADGRQLRFGILGYVGPDAALVSAATRKSATFVGFDDTKSKLEPRDLANLVQKQVAYLRTIENVDAVMLLIHAGDPEDRELAEAVAGIDIVISGHTHQDYDRVVGNTIIAQSGCYGQSLGVMDLIYDHSKVRPASPTALRRIPVDDKIPADAQYLEKIAEYQAAINASLSPKGFAHDSPIVTITASLPKENRLNAPLGHFISSALLEELNSQLDKPSDVYLTAMGVVRTSLNTLHDQPTLYQYSDIFRILPLGFAPDLTLGYPVVSFYLSPSELALLIDTAEVYAWKSKKFALAFSDSLKFRVRNYGIPFLSRITDVNLHDRPLQDFEGLIKVSTNSFVANYIMRISDLTYGFITIQPKNAQGMAIKDLPFDGSLPREFDLLSRYLHARKSYP